MKSLYFIMVTMFLDAFGLGFIIPSLPDVIRRFSRDPAMVNVYFGYFVASYALMQFLASPVLGALSDRYGRRPILLVSLLAAGLDYLLMAYASSLSILFVGRLISGLTGASMTVANSYVGDTSDDSNRSANFGMLGAAGGLGFIAGPAVGGLLASRYGVEAPFLAAAAFNLMNFAFGLLVLPESLPAERRRPVQVGQFHPLRSLMKSARMAPRLIGVYALFFMAEQVYVSVWTLYTEHRYGWDAAQVGLSLGFVGLLIALTQGGLTGRASALLGERRAIRLGLLCTTAGMVAIALAGRGWMMYPIFAATCFSFVAGPALQSLISAGVPSAEQGELQGSLVSIGAMTEFLGPPLYTGLFAASTLTGTSGGFPGSPFLAAALFSAAGLVVLGGRDRTPPGTAVEEGELAELRSD
ncbi:TCR/Tet family MFS transporter [Isosphaeraceae bacterium EP7]